MYAVSPAALYVTSHGISVPLLVRDADDNPSALLMEARLRSGDYFATLSTELERMAASIRLNFGSEAETLEHLAMELSYLDERYVLRPRD